MGFFDLFRSNKSSVKASVSIHVPTAKEHEQQANAEAEEISKLDAKCKKSEHGLSVSQILLLEYCRKGKYPDPKGGYQRFWWFQYGVKDVGAVLKDLEAKGFIRFANPSDMISTLKVGELKQILAGLNLSASGKKDELIVRIKENADDDFLRNYIKADKYTLTPLGEQEVAANEYIPYLHSHKYSEISVWDVNENADPLHWRDYIWSRFNQCSIEYASQGQWGLYRNVRFSMAQFLAEEEKYADAFAMYAEVCFYDVNGMDYRIEYNDPAELIPEAIASMMNNAGNKAALDDGQMRSIISKRVESCTVITRRVPVERMTDLILNKLKAIQKS